MANHITAVGIFVQMSEFTESKMKKFEMALTLNYEAYKSEVTYYSNEDFNPTPGQGLIVIGKVFAKEGRIHIDGKHLIFINTGEHFTPGPPTIVMTGSVSKLLTVGETFICQCEFYANGKCTLNVEVNVAPGRRFQPKVNDHVFFSGLLLEFANEKATVDTFDCSFMSTKVPSPVKAKTEAGKSVALDLNTALGLSNSKRQLFDASKGSNSSKKPKKDRE